MVLVAIAEMFPHSATAKKIDGDDHDTYESMVRMWMKGIEGLTHDQVSQGIVNLLNSGSKFEPSLPEFRALCKESTHKAHQPYVPLPKPEQDKDVALTELEKMREILK